MVVLLAGCDNGPETHQLQGATMGTTWHVTYTGTVQPAPLTADIEATLDAVNASMSTYRPDSEINRVNASPVGEPVPVSAEFAAVLAAALEVGRQSGGAYDVTVGPLVDLWGFGAGRADNWLLPQPAQVEAVLSGVGQSALVLALDGDTLVRQQPVRLDFSSIAKGYAVDRVAEVLAEQGVESYLVEIGGEMRVAGLSPRGDPWRIAVEQPVAGQRGVATALELSEGAVATSGDYRNFVEVDGKHYSHTIDPRTGYPVTHALVSVTVLHESCMMADAWATALSVVGPDDALRLATEHGLAVYLMSRADGDIRRVASPAYTARFGAVTNDG